MNHFRNFAVRKWVESLEPIESVQTEPDDDDLIQRSAKRARRDAHLDVNNEIAADTTLDLPDTPPPTDYHSMSQQAPPASQRKRPINNVADDQGLIGDEGAFSVDKTPTRISITRRPDLQYSRKRSKSRSASPSKIRSRASLEMLEKPVIAIPLPEYAACLKILPEDVRSLFLAIRAAVVNQIRIVPHEVRDEMMALQGIDGDSAIFQPPNQGGGDSASAASQERATFDRLCDIRQCAAEAVLFSRHENAWNNDVHTPLLKLVFSSHRVGAPDFVHGDEGPPPPPVSVRLEYAQSAAIEGDSVPRWKSASESDAGSFAMTVSAGSSTSTTAADVRAGSVSNLHSSTATKRVDYVLVLDLAETSDLHRNISSVIRETSGAGGHKVPPHVNHTTYRPLLESPIAVTLETKAEIPKTDPLLQLGYWIAAWHKRLYELRRCMPCEGNEAGRLLVSVPLIQIIGHAWQVYFACDMGPSVKLYGPLSIGSTDSLLSMYALLGSLRAIKAWVEETFHPAMKRWFLCEDNVIHM